MKCRIEEYFNQYEFNKTGIRVWKPSEMHFFKNNKKRCQCGKVRW